MSVVYEKQREKANIRNRKYVANLIDEQRDERNRGKKKGRHIKKKKKDLNLVQGINDLTLRQQQQKRKYWREASTKYRGKKNN